MTLMTAEMMPEKKTKKNSISSLSSCLHKKNLQQEKASDTGGMKKTH